MPNKANPKLRRNCTAGGEITYSVKSYEGTTKGQLRNWSRHPGWAEKSTEGCL